MADAAQQPAELPADALVSRKRLRAGLLRATGLPFVESLRNAHFQAYYEGETHCVCGQAISHVYVLRIGEQGYPIGSDCASRLREDLKNPMWLVDEATVLRKMERDTDLANCIAMCHRRFPGPDVRTLAGELVAVNAAGGDEDLSKAVQLYLRLKALPCSYVNEPESVLAVRFAGAIAPWRLRWKEHMTHRRNLYMIAGGSDLDLKRMAYLSRRYMERNPEQYAAMEPYLEQRAERRARCAERAHDRCTNLDFKDWARLNGTARDIVYACGTHSRDVVHHHGNEWLVVYNHEEISCIHRAFRTRKGAVMYARQCTHAFF